MRAGAVTVALLVLVPAVALGQQKGVALTAHVSAAGFWAPMVDYSSFDTPILFGADVVVPLTPHGGLSLDTSAGTRERRSLATFAATALFNSRRTSRVTALGGLGIAVRIENGPFQALMVRGRAGVAIDLTRRMYLQPEVLLDVGEGFTTMAAARIGAGYRF